jgi:hypothetical protein|tara:strand:- start:1295 stop:1741 length:447 start_codon:yes stop_codon:yes gene_type:complete
MMAKKKPIKRFRYHGQRLFGDGKLYHEFYDFADDAEHHWQVRSRQMHFCIGEVYEGPCDKQYTVSLNEFVLIPESPAAPAATDAEMAAWSALDSANRTEKRLMITMAAMEREKRQAWKALLQPVLVQYHTMTRVQKLAMKLEIMDLFE